MGNWKFGDNMEAEIEFTNESNAEGETCQVNECNGNVDDHGIFEFTSVDTADSFRVRFPVCDAHKWALFYAAKPAERDS